MVVSPDLFAGTEGKSLSGCLPWRQVFVSGIPKTFSSVDMGSFPVRVLFLCMVHEMMNREAIPVDKARIGSSQGFDTIIRTPVKNCCPGAEVV